MTTKTCPGCGTSDLVRFETLRYKYCVDCHCCIPWALAEGQRPLHGSNRSDRKTAGDK